MPYFTYVAYNANPKDPNRPYLGRNSIGFIEFVKGRKDGRQRLDALIDRHPDFLPRDGWDRIQHMTLDTEDNEIIERMKLDVRRSLAAISRSETGRPRLWHNTPGAPAACYRLDKWTLNRVQSNVVDRSGLRLIGAR